MANKFVTRYVTWVIPPDCSGAYLDCIMKEKEEEAPIRFMNQGKNDHFWDGTEFIHMPIEIQVPKEIENKLREGYAHA